MIDSKKLVPIINSLLTEKETILEELYSLDETILMNICLSAYSIYNKSTKNEPVYEVAIKLFLMGFLSSKAYYEIEELESKVK